MQSFRNRSILRNHRKDHHENATPTVNRVDTQYPSPPVTLILDQNLHERVPSSIVVPETLPPQIFHSVSSPAIHANSTSLPIVSPHFDEDSFQRGNIVNLLNEKSPASPENISSSLTSTSRKSGSSFYSEVESSLMKRNNEFIGDHFKPIKTDNFRPKIMSVSSLISN